MTIMTSPTGQSDLFTIFETVAFAPPTGANWIAPKPDARQVAYLEAEGRSPFSEGGGDAVQWQGVADETINGLVWDLEELATLRHLLSAGRSGLKTSRQWEEFEKSYPTLCASHEFSYEATLDAVLDVWGFAGRDAFDIEARRRARP